MVEDKGRFWLLIGLSALVVAVSAYHYWQKTAVREFEHSSNEAVLTEAGPELIVYVSGAVNHPGVIRLASGARALDAIDGAGGLLPTGDAAKINMAQPLRDGMQIHVPARDIKSNTAGAEQSQTAGQTADRININTAGAQELDRLPGIGPSIAEKIIQYRESNGNFSAIEDLKKVPGIGESKYNKMKDRIGI